MKLQNKVIIVTGASKGLGVAMARVCAAEGARVVCAARSVDRLEAVVAGIVAAGREAIGVRCDMAQPADLHALVDQTVKRYGAIHGLINNAGVNFVKPFVDVTEAEWDHVIDVDLKGSFFLSQLCARIWEEWALSLAITL